MAALRPLSAILHQPSGTSKSGSNELPLVARSVRRAYFQPMSPFQKQLAKEARYDTIVATVGLALFFVCGLILPRNWFWYWFAPMALFWFRYLWVRCRRDDILERLDAEATPPTPGCYPIEGGGICIADETHQIVIGRAPAPALSALPEPPQRRLLQRP